MKLAIIGKEGSPKRAVVRHTKKVGFEVATSDLSSPHNLLNPIHEMDIGKAFSNTDAVLLMLHDELQWFDAIAVKYLSHIIQAMHMNGIKRLILSTELHPNIHMTKAQSDSMRDSCLSVMRKSMLDWTIIGYPKQETKSDVLRHDKMAKMIINEITESKNLSSIVMLPIHSVN